MTNKFKATKAGKTEDQVTLEELEQSLTKMTEDRLAKMDNIYEMIDIRFDSILKRYRGCAGMLDIVDAYKRIEDSAMVGDCVVCSKMVYSKALAMQEAWGDLKALAKADFDGQKEAIENFLDQWLDPDFVATMDEDDLTFYEKVQKFAIETCVMGVCSELWELIRRLLEFWAESGRQIDAVCEKIYELKKDFKDAE